MENSLAFAAMALQVSASFLFFIFFIAIRRHGPSDLRPPGALCV
jgi:hypothetical protein